MKSAPSSEISRRFLMLVRSARGIFLRARTGLLTLLLALAVCGTLFCLMTFIDLKHSNTAILALNSNEDIAVDAQSAEGEVLIARLAYVLRQGRRDEAQAIADASRNGRATAQERARLLTILGNSRVKTALSFIEAGRQNDAIPEVRLAKENFREAMRLDPGFWDAKHNYDVAMRLVRDLPTGEGDEEDAPPDAPARLWTDLPGVPRGLP